MSPLGFVSIGAINETKVMLFHTHQLLAIFWSEKKRAALSVQKCGGGGENKICGARYAEKFQSLKIPS